MGQLQEAGGAGPAVFSYLAGCTLPAAHTLPGTGGARSQAQAGWLKELPILCLLTIITSASPLASSLHLIITHEPPIEANYHAHGSPIGFSPVTEAPLTSRPASSLEHASGTLCTRHQSIRPANSPSTPCPPCRTVRRKAGCNYLKHPLLSVEGNSLR